MAVGFADWGGLGGGDAFSLPMNPRAELAAALGRAGGSLPTSHAIPYGVRDWVVCEYGDHLRWRRAEKSNDAVRALGFLVRHYLGRDALAKESGHPDSQTPRLTSHNRISARRSGSSLARDSAPSRAGVGVYP